MKKSLRYVVSGFFIIMMMVLMGCVNEFEADVQGETLHYEGSKALDTALDNGEDVIGATATFTVVEGYYDPRDNTTNFVPETKGVTYVYRGDIAIEDGAVMEMQIVEVYEYREDWLVVGELTE